MPFHTASEQKKNKAEKLDNPKRNNKKTTSESVASKFAKRLSDRKA